LAQLALQLRLVPADEDVPTAVHAAQAWLRSHRRWLVVFDNAEDASAVHEWLPDGPGQVVFTSRSGSWAGTAVPVEVDVTARAESIALLRGLAPALVVWNLCVLD
jgi:hypothetical protein